MTYGELKTHKKLIITVDIQTVMEYTLFIEQAKYTGCKYSFERKK
ncbi:hypothetical protein SAMN02745945_02718 [Peptoclostridium litorale DSM 5388]|uniref:Uncharacterized protein n=1 Tax=Peptoclostridium litorale DSM 5388 TaxID=1121324 RepID=A0A069REL4_PEPLI|nr:hypothetical protein CLIT_14c00660 [Peptoclostridium litorale DSM 5388]SIO32028.1 hypothetical protein SAMN02745945_02718 [Peptoclostridium litorale DSM 5388]